VINDIEGPIAASIVSRFNSESLWGFIRRKVGTKIYLNNIKIPIKKTKEDPRDNMKISHRIRVVLLATGAEP
jgi:hypothetical protein